MTAYATLREANAVRQAEWDKAGGIDLVYRGNEMAGEMGEVFEVACRLVDFLSRGAGSDELAGFRRDLADELADAEICIDLIAMGEGLPPVATYLKVDETHRAKYTPLDRAMIALRLGAAAGQANNIIKKLARERMGIRGSRSTPQELSSYLSRALYSARLLAWIEGIDLDAAVRRKFNATSEKVGLETRMQEPA